MPAFARDADAAEDAAKPRNSVGRFPKDVAGLEEMSRQAIAEENALRLLQTTILLRRQEPYEPDHMVNMVRAYAMMNRPTSAYHYMLEMQQQGLSFDFNQLDETAAMRDTEVYAYLNDLLIRAGEPAGDAAPAFEIDSDHAYPTGIAWDETRGSFLVGTAREGALLEVNEKGKARELLSADDQNGLWAVMDIEVDAANNRLWVSTAVIPQFSGYSAELAGESALLAFELDSLEPVGRYPFAGEGPAQFGSMALDPNGDVYVADRASASLYRKASDAYQVTPFMADQELSGFRDITMSKDGARIYLADSAKGILVIDPENETAAMLEGPDTLNLGGIEGLFQVGSELIIIQSLYDPQRMLSLQLDPSGGKVLEVRPMAIALEWFDGPSLGTVHDEAVYYFASAGLPETGTASEEVTVLRTSLDAGANIVAPDMRKFEEETLTKARDN
jgi:sugar lactone lactonase YvrE